MAFWVTVQDSIAGEKTLVSHATSELAARNEAEKSGLIVDDVAPISSNIDPAELRRYEHLTVSRAAAFQICCLIAGQMTSLLLCIGCLPLAISMFLGASDTPQVIEVRLMALLVGALLLCTCASLFIVFTYVKRQLAQTRH